MEGKSNLEYVFEVLDRFKGELDKIENAKSPIAISTSERDAMVLLKELQMALPRIALDLRSVSEKRRRELMERR